MCDTSATLKQRNISVVHKGTCQLFTTNVPVVLCSVVITCVYLWRFSTDAFVSVQQSNRKSTYQNKERRNRLTYTCIMIRSRKYLLLCLCVFCDILSLVLNKVSVSIIPPSGVFIKLCGSAPRKNVIFRFCLFLLFITLFFCAQSCKNIIYAFFIEIQG